MKSDWLQDADDGHTTLILVASSSIFFLKVTQQSISMDDSLSHYRTQFSFISHTHTTYTISIFLSFCYRYQCLMNCWFFNSIFTTLASLFDGALTVFSTAVAHPSEYLDVIIRCFSLLFLLLFLYFCYY